MHKISSELPDASVQRWTEAGASLASALRAYLSACSHLETFSSSQNSAYATDLVYQIDSSLDSLHITLDRELAQSRVILARTRNRTASPLYLFPREILSKIFEDVIYAPTPEERAKDPPPIADLQTIYRRLHSLIGVCSVWRRVAIDCCALWSVIPMVDSGLKVGPVQHLATNLSLERASTRLHLAAVLDRGGGCGFSGLFRHAHRFQSCDIQSQSIRGIAQLIKTLLECGNFTLSELSISHDPTRNQMWEDLYVPRECRYFIDRESSFQSQFTTLLKSLSVLRVVGTLIHWDKVTFSTRLSKIHLQAITIGYDTTLVRFLFAISSASELRELIIGSVAAFSSTTPPTPISAPVVCLPNLQSLVLADLSFNVLELVLRSISAGSHQLTLFPTENSSKIHTSDHSTELVDVGDLLELFRSVTVDTLMLEGGRDDNWITRTRVRGLLQAMPGLRKLYLDNWVFRDSTDWLSLKERFSGTVVTGRLRFPVITELYLTGTRILRVEDIKQVVARHSLQKLVIGACICTKDTVDIDDTSSCPLFQDEHPDVVAWLRSTVPDVRLIDAEYLPMEFKAVRWRLCNPDV